MPTWFGIHEIPATADSPKDESGLLQAVQDVHATIDKEIAAGTNPTMYLSVGSVKEVEALFLVDGFPFNSSMVERTTNEAKRAYQDLDHSINNEELKSLESWIKTRLQSSS